MMMNRTQADAAFLRRRLELPLYQVKDAARLAKVSAQTVLNWENPCQGTRPVSTRRVGASLSYLQLVELRFVAAMRKAGLKLETIRRARNYMEGKYGDFPFAKKQLIYDGKQLALSLEKEIGQAGVDKLVIVSQGGQTAWRQIIGDSFNEFDYGDDLATRWHPDPTRREIIVDPNIAFGAPSIRGVGTWVLRRRHDAGESIPAIAEDFELTNDNVVDALRFEGVLNHRWTLH